MNNTAKFKAGDLIQFQRGQILLSIHLVCDFEKCRYSVGDEFIIVTTVILGDLNFYTGDYEKFYSSYLNLLLSNGSAIIL